MTIRPLLRVTGALLLLLGAVPLPWLLAPERTGPAGLATRDALLGVSAGLVGPLASIVVLGVGLALLPSARGALAALERRARRGLLRPVPVAWVIGCAAVGGLGAAGADAFLLRGEPTLVDEMVQLAEARDVAGLQPGVDAPPAMVRLQNGTVVDGEWRSVYPPGHTVLIAAAMRAGLERVLGVVLAALWSGGAALLFLRLLGDGSIAARLAGLGVAAAPMAWLLGAGRLSHTSALAAVVCAWLAAERIVTRPGRRRTLALGVLLGAAAGWAVTARPWTGLVLAVLLPGTWVWLRAGTARAAATAGALAGGLPFAVALGAWNATRFGSPLRFGYDATFGPSHGLGWHVDPWGNAYGVVEAIGYTAADLFLVGPSMFGLPIPLAGLVGLGLVAGPIRHLTDRERGALGLGVSWIALALVANAAYWHHGLHFGPRMLFETLPAWALVGAMLLVATLRAGGPIDGGRDGAGAVRARLARSVPAATVVVAAALYLPGLLGGAAVGDARRAQLPAPDAVAALPDSAVVLVHGSWASRVAARAAEFGLRADSIETALRRNGLCEVELWVRARVTGAAGAADLDFRPLPGTPSSLVTLDASPGNRVRVDPDRALAPACLRELAADRFGGLELEALRGRTDRTDVAWVRDLGPERIPAGVPSERMRVLVPAVPGGRPEFVPLEEGLVRLWGSAPEVSGAGTVSGSGPGL